MTKDINNLNTAQDNRADRPSYFPPDQTPRREGGDDSLAEASPNDPRDDEKVLVNEQRERKTVNQPSKTAATTNEEISNDEETVDNS